MNATDQSCLALELMRITASGTSEGVRKSWEHRQRSEASAALKDLRKGGYKGKVSIEHDPRKGVYFLRKQEGELAERKKPEEITPYDKEIRRMKKFGTRDLHGALTDAIYDDQQARAEFEGDNPEASWEDAAGDLAANYLAMHKLPHQIRSSERIVVEVVKAGAPIGNKNAAGTHNREGLPYSISDAAKHVTEKKHAQLYDPKEKYGRTDMRAEAYHEGGKIIVNYNHDTYEETKENLPQHVAD